MLRLSLRIARRSVRSTGAQSKNGSVRCFGLSLDERWEDEKEKDRTSGPVVSATDMELYKYNPRAILDELDEGEDKEEEKKRIQMVREELESRTGRGWTDPWEISEADWSTSTEHDDLPDWNPSMASKISLERVKVLDGVLTLSEMSKLSLPPPPPPHPSSDEARAFAEARKEQQYKYLLGRVKVAVEPKIAEIEALSTWEEKQDAVDELFETVEFYLKKQETVLGRHPKFGFWIEKALEEYLESIQKQESESNEEDEASKDGKAVPVFMDLYDKSDAPDGDVPMVPKILHPLKPHPKDGFGRMVEEWELSAHGETRRIMMRQSTREIARILDEKDSVRVYVNGDKGVGKTAALISVVAGARKSGHIVLYAPDGDRLRKYGFYVEPNTAHEGIFDLPMLSQELCASLLESHEHDLGGMSAPKEMRDKHLSEDIEKRLPEGAIDDLSLVGLLKLAAEEAVFASMCYSTVVEALMNQEEKPFLMVLDEFNCYYDHGHYFHMDYDAEARKAIPIEQISLFKPFMDTLGLGGKEALPIKKGGIVVGVSENRAVGRSTTDALTASATEAAEDADSAYPMHVVTVPRYSIVEIEHVLSNFDVTGIGRLRFDRGDTVMDQQEVGYLRMVSGSNAQLLLDACIV